MSKLTMTNKYSGVSMDAKIELQIGQLVNTYIQYTSLIFLLIYHSGLSKPPVHHRIDQDLMLFKITHASETVFSEVARVAKVARLLFAYCETIRDLMTYVRNPPIPIKGPYLWWETNIREKYS